MATVQSIDRAFDLLQALAVRALSLSELAVVTDLPVSTVSRLVGTLSELDAVERDDDGKYRVGPLVAALAGGIDPAATLEATAQAHMAALAERIGESSGLSVPVGDRVLYISHIDVESDVQIREWTGTRAPMHVVSGGLAVLANMPASFIDRYLAKPLVRSTAASVVDPDLIRDRLAAARSVGYVWTGEEFVEGIASVASPVFNAEGLVGSLHVHGPAYRFPGDLDLVEVGEIVRDAAADLTAALS